MDKLVRNSKVAFSSFDPLRVNGMVQLCKYIMAFERPAQSIQCHLQQVHPDARRRFVAERAMLLWISQRLRRHHVGATCFCFRTLEGRFVKVRRVEWIARKKESPHNYCRRCTIEQLKPNICRQASSHGLVTTCLTIGPLG